ncbi:MAG: tripartite tricarboxylate transporter TctB family protein [Caldimonas sp.]
MKFNDALWGALLVLFGGTLFVHVQGFPSIPGQQVGPGLFPGTLGVGLVLCGLLLVARGLKQRATRTGDTAWMRLPEWAHRSHQRLGFGVLVAVNVMYLLVVDRLGFVITGVIYLAALMAVLRVPRARILPLALMLTLVIHFAFYKLLRVPLPWGLLQPIAW